MLRFADLLGAVGNPREDTHITGGHSKLPSEPKLQVRVECHDQRFYTFWRSSQPLDIKPLKAFGSCAEGIAGLTYFGSLPIQLEDDGAVSAISLVNLKSVTLDVTSNI